MKKFLNLLVTAVTGAVIVVFTVCLIVVAFQVFNRFVTKIPIIWTSSLATVLLIWLGLLTASLAVRRDEHFRMEALMHSVGGSRFGAAMRVLSWVVILLVSTIILIYGIDLTIDSLREISSGLGVSMAWAYAALPVSAAISVLFALEGLLAILCGERLSAPTGEDV